MLSIDQPVIESLKEIITSLQVRFLFPSLLLVISNIALFSSHYVFNEYEIILLISAIATSSLLLKGFNGLIIRLAEGYEFEHNWLYQRKKRKQEERRNELHNKVDSCECALDELTKIDNFLIINNESNEHLDQQVEAIKSQLKKKIIKLKMELQNFHPNKTLPTNLGNTISAFEHYPKQRYGIDAVCLWTRMIPLLEKNNFINIIQNEKITLDFFLNVGLVLIILSAETLISFGITSNGLYAATSFSLLLISLLMYYGADAIARDWGVTVCAAFDLYREDLRKDLYLTPIPSHDIATERKYWDAYSRFILYGESEEFDGFDYSKKVASDN